MMPVPSSGCQIPRSNSSFCQGEAAGGGGLKVDVEVRVIWKHIRIVGVLNSTTSRCKFGSDLMILVGLIGFDASEVHDCINSLGMISWFLQAMQYPNVLFGSYWSVHFLTSYVLQATIKQITASDGVRIQQTYMKVVGSRSPDSVLIGT